MDRPPAHPEPDGLLAQLGWMRTLARRLVRDPDVADDVLQRACLLALESPEGVTRSGVTLRAWLAAVTRRLVGHARRSEERRSARERLAARPEALPATIDLAARRELLRKLVQAVTELDEPAFSTIVRRYYEGRSIEEIATEDQLTSDAVRQRLARARRQLRARLEPALGTRGWLPALALVPSSSSVARPTLRGLFMAERSTRPLLFKFGAATLAAGLCLTSWLVLSPRSTSGEDSQPEQAAHITRAGWSDEARAAVPLLRSVEPAPTLVSSEAMAPLTPAAADVAATAPAPSFSSASWDQLWRTTDGIVQGNVGLDDVLASTQALLALAQSQLADPAQVNLMGGGAPGVRYALIDAPGFGKVSFTVSPGPEAQQRDYAFDIELDTRDGYYSGLSQGRAESTRLAIKVGAGPGDGPRYLNAMVQNMCPQTAELGRHLAGQPPLSIGGSLTVRPQGSEWRPLTLQTIAHGREIPGTSETAEEDGVMLAFGEPVARVGMLTDPRVSALTQDLGAVPFDAGH